MATKTVVTILEMGLLGVLASGFLVGLFMLAFPQRSLLPGHRTRWPGLVIVGFYLLVAYLYLTSGQR